MKLDKFAAHLFKSALAASALLLAGGAAHAQQAVNLGAGPATTTLPDGNVVPMWGYTCGPAVTGSTATCQALNPAVQAANVAATTGNSGQWSPVVITIPTGQDLQINLANNLSFPATVAGTTTVNGVNNIPTSLTIVGQLGGGLGTNPTYVGSPIHPQFGQTWPTANVAGTVFTPPAQPARVQSFATEVQAGTTTSLCWGVCGNGGAALKPGTYLIESGTHPSIQGPMGLHGILVVTSAPTSAAGVESAPGTAYPNTSLPATTQPFYASTGVSYDAEVAVELSEIDPSLNNAVSVAVGTAGFAENASQVLGTAVTGYTVTTTGAGYSFPATGGGTTTSGTVPIQFFPTNACKILPQGSATITGGVVSSIALTPVTSNTSSGTVYGTGCVDTVITGTVPGGTTNQVITLTLSTQNVGAQCGIPVGGSAPAAACYPPAVNYTPQYFLVNGSAFNQTSPTASYIPTVPGALSGTNLLVRLVNAGLKLHVPAIVGATTTTSYSASGKVAAHAVPGLTLVATDGNPLPGVPRIQSEVIMPAGKTYDVLINAAAVGAPAQAIYDRELSLSGGTINRNSGMLAYIGANGGSIPVSAKTAVAVADTYNVLLGNTGQVVTIADPSKGVIANDSNVFGVTLLTAPTNGTVTLNRNGTFSYTATGTATTDSFTYCANGSVTAGVCSSGITATVSFGQNAIAGDTGVTCGTIAFNATTSSQLKINPPGVLAACVDKANLPITVQGATASTVNAATGLITPATTTTATMTGPGTGTAILDANGGFTATVSAPGTYTFPVSAVNLLNLGSPTPGTVTVTFPSASNLTVSVIDGADKKSLITDYHWIIEEDTTFYVDPNCTTNPVNTTLKLANGKNECATLPGANANAQFNAGTSFHTSSVNVIAQGCTGPLSCELGQTLKGVPAVCDIGNGVCRTTGNQLQPTFPSQVALDPTKRYYISVLPGDAANPFGQNVYGSGSYNGPSQCASAVLSAPVNGFGQVSVPTGTCGHGMGGAPINRGQTSVIILTQPSPYPTAHVTAYVYEDDYPLNGEIDTGGGVDVLAAAEPGLGGFQILLQDVAGGTGDMTGTPTYDMFNQPLSNAMAGTIDPVSLLDACPISVQDTSNAVAAAATQITPIGNLANGATTFNVSGTSIPAALTVGATLADNSGVIPAGTTVVSVTQSSPTAYTVTMSAPTIAASPSGITDPINITGSQLGITGMVVTCPKYESDGQTLSPLAGMAMISNLYPGRYSVQAIPGADRIARGEEWLQTNTLDGQKGHDAFLRIGEPAYFQEYGPAGFHVNIGYANPKIINNRRHNAGNTGWCDSGNLNSLSNSNGTAVGAIDCSNTVKGVDTLARMSRTPDERLYSSGSRTALKFTQCYAALSDPDGATFAFSKCDPVTGAFYFGPSSPAIINPTTGAVTQAASNDGVPAGNWMLTIFDEWNDQIIDGISMAVEVGCSPSAGGGLCNSTAQGTATGNVTSGSTTLTITTNLPPGLAVGASVSDAAGAIPAGTTVTAINGTAVTLGFAATATATGDAVTFTSAVALGTGQNITIDLGEVATNQWQANIYTKTFIDPNGTGLWQDSAGAPTKLGVILVPTNVRFRDGSISNINNTDASGLATFNEVFPLFNWYVIETDDSRFKNTGVHIVYDAGGPSDNSTPFGTPCATAGYTSGLNPCGTSVIGTGLANTYEKIPLPTDLRIPGAVYCANADCYGKSENAEQIALAGGSTTSDSVAGTYTDDTVNGGVKYSTGFSTGRIDPPLWWGTYGWQGYSGQGNFIEWGKKPFVPNETGGIRGHVVYASTRPFDNPALLLQNQWEPLVPRVQINLYKQTVAADGVTPVLTLIDHTTTTSWDDWAQGYRTDVNGNLVYSSDPEGGAIPNMACPGQSTSDLFFYGIKNQPQWFDFYNNVLHGSASSTILPAYNSQFKCYEGMHNWNQLVPAPYDGMYSFPSVTGFNPTTGQPSGTNCTACVTNVDVTDAYRYGGSTTVAPYVNPTYNASGVKTGGSAGTPVLPAGNYVVEVVVPPNYQIVKEEDKNILIGDDFIQPAVQQIPNLGTNIFILPDQAAIGSTYNVNNAQNPTVSLGRNVLPNSESDTNMQEQYWPCVGALRQVPDFLGLYPQAQQVSPFAGAYRNLCDRKAITLNDQTSALAKFYIWTPTHIASHFTGIILDDFTSEFDPYSPQFGEKFAVGYVPVSVKDWAGNEISRLYSDQFGIYNGLTYSTWEVNPPNPTGYAPTMMVMCMNDSGYGTINPWWDASASGLLQTSTKQDPFFQVGYSQFCYELAFMPGRTGYFDTPLTPDGAFVDGYNHPDCSYPNLTPAVASVLNTAAETDGTNNLPINSGPWVQAPGHFITINALGDTQVDNYGYSGPSNLKGDPWNAQRITRHYGFGGTPGTVTIGGVNAPVAAGNWTDTAITVAVPAGIPACEIQQQVQYGVPSTTVPSTVTTATFITTWASGVTTLTVFGGAPTGLAVGNTLTAAGIAAGTTVQSITTTGTGLGRRTNIVISAKTTAASKGIAGLESVTASATTTITVPNTAYCGQLQITTATGQTSVDTVTVTVGGKAPTVLPAGATIQSGIDSAQPGDMVIVPPGVYHEMVVMWKPVRLQGVGAASSTIDANTQPAGKLLNPWRTRIDCLFGLTTQGRPRVNNDLGCATGWTDATGYQTTSVDGKINDAILPTILVDRLPFEAILGWDAGLNGNLAEQSIEPSLMGAEEGAAITVLAKGVRFADVSANPTGLIDAFGASPGDIATNVGAAYPNNTVLLSAADCQANTTLTVPSISSANVAITPVFGPAVGGTDTTNRYPGNYYCNPSAIDGLGLRDASQGGGGIYVHAYAHYLQIANNRVYNNLGTLSGGITIGQGEHPDINLGGTGSVLTAPYTCDWSNAAVTNAPMPFCFDTHVNVHNNAVYANVSLGDELFSSTPAGAGGISVNTGADYYTVSNNWICGNLSSGDGGGFSHIGWIKDGLVANNQVLFNKTSNPSIVTNGAGVLVMGAPDVDPTGCGVNNDQDCQPLVNTIAPSDGVGSVTINANLILGNSADAGSGGGVRLQYVNGNDLVNWPNPTAVTNNGAPRNAVYTNYWNSVSLTNNIIVNNVAGWDGGGISLQDSLYVNIVNNTVAHNDSTATAGPLFGSLFAPMSSAPTAQVGCYATANAVAGAGGTPVTGVASCAQVAGIVSITNSAVLQANTVKSTGTNAATALVCPASYGGANCYNFSSPVLFNDLVWQNRSFVVTTGGLGAGNSNQQQVVTLMNADASFPASNVASNPLPVQSQSATGMCPTTGSAYWDLGVRGDVGPKTPQVAGIQFSPTYSAIDDLTLYSGAALHNVGGTTFTPAFLAAYCNGGRTPPEAGGQGWFVPPGTNETQGSVNGGAANGTNPMYFSLVATATTDEGNNWINMRWGPLSLTQPSLDSANSNLTAPVYLGNYGIGLTSSAIGTGSAIQAGIAAPAADFYGHPRPDAANRWDIGAVEPIVPPAVISVGSTTVSLGNVQTGQVASQTVTITNASPAGGSNLFITAANITVAPNNVYIAANPGTCLVTAGIAPGASCTVNILLAPTGNSFTTSGTAEAATVSIASNASNGTQTIAASGTAFAPIVTLNPVGTIAFGTDEAGSSNNTFTRVVTATNTGYGPWYPTITLTNNATNSGFSQTNTCTAGTPLAINGTCQITVTFTATTRNEQADSGSLTVGANAYLGAAHATFEETTSATDNLTATAAGVSVGVSPTNLNFGIVADGSTKTLTFTLTNQSTAALNAVTATASGTGFAVTANGCNPAGGVAHLATCTISVTYTPSGGNQLGNGTAQTGTVTLSSEGVQLGGPYNVTGTPELPVALSASGFTGTATNATATVTVTNNEPSAVTLSLASFSIAKSGGAGNTTMSILGGTCATNVQIPAGGSCTIGVTSANGNSTKVLSTYTVTVTPVVGGTAVTAETINLGNN